jgi:hypothetical protein
MEAWQFLIFFHERYKSLDQYVKGKASGHFIRQQAHYVSTLDIPLKLLSETIERKTKRKCVLNAGRHKFESVLSEGIIHGSRCWRSLLLPAAVYFAINPSVHSLMLSKD